MYNYAVELCGITIVDSDLNKTRPASNSLSRRALSFIFLQSYNTLDINSTILFLTEHTKKFDSPKGTQQNKKSIIISPNQY